MFYIRDTMLVPFNIYVFKYVLLPISVNSITYFVTKYFNNSKVLYASKAASFKRIYEIMKEEDMSVDVVSGGELFTALAAGFPAENIFFHGNNKSKEEIDFLKINYQKIGAKKCAEILGRSESSIFSFASSHI